MNRIALCSLIACGVLSIAAATADRGARERTFVQAMERFDAAKSPADYRDCAELLESILSDGYRSGAVYYNLGNAYYRAGQYGRAILNYRKAKPYRPRDPYLTANLEQAVTAAPGHLPEPPAPWWTHVLFWTEWLSFPSKVYSVTLSSSLGALTAVLAVLLRRSRLRWLSLALVIVTVALASDVALCRSQVEGAQHAVITSETIARKGTGTSYEAAFDQPLRDGAEFTVLTATPDWTFGHFESIGDGWVRNEFVAR